MRGTTSRNSFSRGVLAAPAPCFVLVVLAAPTAALDWLAVACGRRVMTRGVRIDFATGLADIRDAIPSPRAPKSAEF